MPPPEQEVALRRLALGISTIVRSTPDVLESKFAEVPDVSGAVFDPPIRTEAAPLPSCYRFVDDFARLSPGTSLEELIEQFRLAKELLIWGHNPSYNKDNVGQTFLDNYCHALLTGPDGPLKCVSPLGAFVMFGPNTLYKDHSHAPNEVYLALTGGGEWRVGGHAWQQLDAGQTIFIPSQAAHAIRSGGNPLLTFSFWLEPGDLEAIAI